MFRNKKQKQEVPKEFTEEDYSEEEMGVDRSSEEETEKEFGEETEEEKPQLKSPKPMAVQKKERESESEEKQLPVNLTEQDILALAKWHIARSFELLKLLN